MKCAKCVVQVWKGRFIIRMIILLTRFWLWHIVQVVKLLVVNKVFATGNNSKEFLSADYTPYNSHKSSTETSQEISDDELVFDVENPDITQDQKEIRLHFLKQNKDVIPAGLHNLGRTHVQTHTIDTGDAPPVRLPHYRQITEIRCQTEKQVKKC